MTSAFQSNAQSRRDSVQPKIDSLAPIIVRPKAIRPKIHGDTMEYNTGSIQLRVNANTEELLSRLPGLHISPDGTITYNGETIKQLLVDGEDLFASDPTIVTRNFDASRIARIQLYDRISDHARFTGIDDGNRIKTLNLVLKEDSKQGYFGKVEAGANLDGIYNANALLGSFQRRQQLAALGFASNTGTTGFANNTGGSLSDIASINSSDDALGANAGKGIPQFHAIALHYANTWDGTRDHLVGNYQYSNFLTKPVTTTNTIQTLPDSVYSQHQQAQSVNQQNQHWVYGTYDWTINKISALQLGFRYTNTVAINQYTDTSLSAFNNVTINRAKRNIKSIANKNTSGANIGWRIESKKVVGRIFSISTSYNSAGASNDGFLYSLNRFYQPSGAPRTSDTIDQRKKITNQTFDINNGFTFSQPLWRKNILGLSYNMFYVGNRFLQSTYDKGDGKYLEYIDSLSSHFNSHTTTQTASLSLQGNNQIFRYAITSGVQWYTFQQKDFLADSSTRYHSFNFTPRISLNYSPNPTTHVFFDYEGIAQQPDINQLQSTKNNNDPLHIRLGNPELHPSFNQSWKLQLTRTGSLMYSLSFRGGLNSNNISIKTIIDSLGREISQPVNVNGGHNLNLNLIIHKQIRGTDVGFLADVSYIQNSNYINANLSNNTIYSSGAGLQISRYVADKYSFQWNTRFTYFDSRSLINTAAAVHYWSQNHNGSILLFFIPGFEVGTTANYTWQQKTNAFAKSTSILLWNASVGHNFMANRLTLRLTVNNLLNQNSGISRSNSGIVNTESLTNILGQYWLLSFSYRFDHKSKRK